jgi:hypothetical protein
MAWLRGLALFALLVAVPFLLEQLVGHNPQIPRVSDSFWRDALSYSGFGIVVFLFLGFLLVLLLYLPRTYEISEWLTLAEREMNSLLRGWGGGLADKKRQDWAVERAQWLERIPVPKEKPEALADVYKQFFELNQKDLTGGSQGDNMGKARSIAFLLREVYEGNVRNAQIKLLNEARIAHEAKPGSKPFMVSGLREILDYDEIVDKKKLPDKWIGWPLMTLTVKLNNFPKEIIMVRADKSYAHNWEVINELTTPLRPKPA